MPAGSGKSGGRPERPGRAGRNFMSMDVKEIEKIMEPEAASRGCFIVGVDISDDNDITLTIESEEGTVTMDDCVALNNAFEAAFDRIAEDYSLTVTSAGLDQPFRILKQFLKAVGTTVEVKFKGGKKLTGELTGADETSISLRHKVREVVEGKKRKELVEHEDTFSMTEVNSVMPYIDFD